MKEDIEDGYHGDDLSASTLIVNKLLALCAVGAIMWMLLIQAAVFVWEVL